MDTQLSKELEEKICGRGYPLPFSHGPYHYFTDGIVLLRCERDGDDEPLGAEQLKTEAGTARYLRVGEGAAKIGTWGHEHMEFMPLPENIPPCDYNRCEECGGKGVVYECEKCEGEGEVECGECGHCEECIICGGSGKVEEGDGSMAEDPIRCGACDGKGGTTGPGPAVDIPEWDHRVTLSAHALNAIKGLQGVRIEASPEPGRVVAWACVLGLGYIMPMAPNFRRVTQ